MESEKFSSSGLYWLCKEAENRSSAVDSPAPPPMEEKAPDLELSGAAMAAPAAGEKRRRGRPAKAAVAAQVKRKKKEDEDVCFICFDGGSLVLCDRGDCPKAYHPACIKRDESFFRSKARWNCGWHICSKCQRSAARYMCYTCTYSLCKGCTKDADYLCVRGNKGFCSTCFRVIKMIENIDQENKETVQVDFDDKLSWEYLFKVYWMCLKTDLSLTVAEITRAQKPSTVPNKVTRRERSSALNHLGDTGTTIKENPTIQNTSISCTPVISVRDNNNTSVISATWASKELLDFVAYMRNGDTSALSQKEVQALLFDHIKRNNLRDPHQRSEIICDPKLENLFGKPRVRHFEMLSLLEFHFLAKDEPQKDEIQGGIIDPVVRQVAGESNSDNLPMISESYSHNNVDKTNEERVDINMSHEVKDACEKLEHHVDSSGSTNNGHNNQACLKSESLSGVKSEASVASLSTGSTPSANDREAENSWHYQDPNGKIQGPFGIEQLHKWSSTGIFPSDMRIWRLNTEQRDSVLLSDVIRDQVPLQNNLSLSPQEVKGTSVSTSHHCDGPKSGSSNSAAIDTDAHSNGKLDSVKGNGLVPHSSTSKAPVINNDLQINNDVQTKNSSKCWDMEPPKVVDSYLNNPQVKSDAQIKSSSKSWDPKPPKVVDSNLNNPQVKNDAQIKSSSKCRDREPPKVVDSYLNNPQVKNDAQIKITSKCWDPKPPKVVDCNLNNPQVKNDAQIKSSSKCRDPEPPKVVDSYLNNPQVKNDAQIKISSKGWDPEPPKVVDSNLNRPQVKNDAQIKTSKCWDPEPAKVVESYLNKTQVNNDTQIKSSSKHLDPKPPKVVVDSYLNDPQVKNDSQIKKSSKSWEPEPPKVVDSYLNQPQVNNNAQIKKSPKFWDPEIPKVVDSYLNQTQVNNDAQIKSSSKGWDLEPPKVVNFHLNQSQMPSVERPSPFKEKPHETNQHQDRSKVGQMWNIAQNYENWSSQGNMLPQTTGKEFHENQMNEQRYIGHPSSEAPIHQARYENNWNSHESHPHYTAMANLTDSSGQKFTINLQDFPMAMPKTSTGLLQAQNLNEQQRWPPPEVSVQNSSIQNVLSLTPKSIDHDEKNYFRNEKVSSLTDNFDKVRAIDNKHTISSNFPAEDCGPSWSRALGGGTQLPKKATKPSMDEWDASFLSVCSLRPDDVANNHVATPTSKGDELPPPSPPNPVPNASSWLAMMTEPIEFNTLAEESVSDLLAEVDAMESNSDLESPNMLMDYADDLFHDTKTDCFTSLRGLSSPQDRSRNDVLCSSIDIMLPPPSNMRDEKIRAPSNDVALDPVKKSKKHSSTSSAMEVETKRLEIPTNKHNLSPPKKIRDLADIMNAPTKHGNSNSGSTRRESGQGTPRGSGSKNRSNPDGMSGRESGRESGHQKHGGERLTSPRERNVTSALTSPRDRNAPGGDSGFSKGRQSWSRPSSFGGGGSGSGSHSRSLPRGQRVCKFYENGYCRKGAFCEYLHP